MHHQRREGISFFWRSVASALATALFTIPFFPARAAQFGELEVRSHLGAPLRANFSVHPDFGETLSEQCLRVVSPIGSGLPAIPGVRLSLEPSAAGGVRLEVSAASVGEPAMRFAVAADCGAGKSLREYAVLALPDWPRVSATSSGDASLWSLGPGETPAGMANVLFPSQPGLQRRLVSAIAELNPSLAIGDGTRSLPAGTLLVMPDWKHFAIPKASAVRPPSREALPSRVWHPEKIVGRSDAVVAPLRRAREPVLQEFPFFRLARTLSGLPVADERLREILRLEYRLLTALNDQLAMMHPALPAGHAEPVSAPRVFVKENEAAVLRIDPVPDIRYPPVAAAVTDAAAAPSSVPLSLSRSSGNSLPDSAASLPPPVETSPGTVPPLAERSSRPPVAAEAVVVDNDALPYYVVAVGAVFLAGVLVVSRRRGTSAVMPPTTEIFGGETLVLDHPPSAPQPSIAVARQEGFSGDPQLSVSEVPAHPAAEGRPTATDANPVMELAEIMLSFGRLQGAAQTLQEYIDANPRDALQPWIKLLGIYLEGGMQDEYEALAARLNETYNVEIQSWAVTKPSDKACQPVGDRGQEFSRVFTLEELPHVRDRLVADWGKPACLDYLHHLLRDNRNGKRNGFTLPVIQEILFLIDILVVREAS